jgi:hypothetical protein
MHDHGMTMKEPSKKVVLMLKSIKDHGQGSDGKKIGKNACKLDQRAG